MGELTCTSVTHAIPVPEVEEGRRWYAQLFGREPDLVPAPSVYEWKLRDGAWLQITSGTIAVGESGQLLLIGVRNLDQEVGRFTALGGQLAERLVVPGLITIQDLRDPFGNRICFYEEPDGEADDRPPAGRGRARA